MEVHKLLALIPEKDLEFLAADTKVDHQVKKLDGICLFRLILYSMLNSHKVSLRIMEHFYSTAAFRTLAGRSDGSSKFNSIRDRIVNINSDFFERLFYSVFDNFNVYFKEKDALCRFDSTMIAASAKLVDWSMTGGLGKMKRQIKLTVGMQGSFPCHVEIFTEKRCLNENLTIPVAIANSKVTEGNIVVFDRGVQKRAVFDSLSEEDQIFVTRIKTNILYEIIKVLQIKESVCPETGLVIKKSLVIKLKDGDLKLTKHEFRLIKAYSPKTEKDIFFLTNIPEMDEFEIALIYKKRWEIEVLFKFLKQHLCLEHLVTRKPNGIKVMLYMTLILAILIIAYKKSNNLKGYKIVKFAFATKLENLIIKDIVVLCGGDPDKAKHLFNSS